MATGQESIGGLRNQLCAGSTCQPQLHKKILNAQNLALLATVVGRYIVHFLGYVREATLLLFLFLSLCGLRLLILT